MEKLDEHLIEKAELQSALFIDTVIDVVFKLRHIPLNMLFSKTRKREVVETRQYAMYFSKQFTNASLATIGEEIGGKDHATVLHACRRIPELYETEKSAQQLHSSILKQLKVKIHAINVDLIVCGTCGSLDVKIKAWINVNTKRILSQIIGDDTGDFYCENCDSYTKIMKNSEFLYLMNEEEEKKKREITYDNQVKQYNEQLHNLEKELEV